jgi:hypothetical protein
VRDGTLYGMSEPPSTVIERDVVDSAAKLLDQAVGDPQ